MSFLQTIPPQLVLALGLTVVITAGEIDLSFPAVVAFSGFLFSYTYRTIGSPLLALLFALAVLFWFILNRHRFGEAIMFIGGMSIAGGYGTIVGTFFGAFIIGSLEAGVVATGGGGYWVRLVSGLVMAGSIILNILVGKENAQEAIKKVKERQSFSKNGKD